MISHSANDILYALFLAKLGLDLDETNTRLSSCDIMNDPSKVQLIRQHLEKQGHSNSVLDVERWVTIMLGEYPRILPIKTNILEAGENFRITREEEIAHNSLVRFLKKKGIPLNIAQSVLKQGRIFDRETKKILYTFIHKNEDEGTIVTSTSESFFTGQNDISFIYGSIFGNGGIHIFKDIWDYLAARIRENAGKPFKNDSIILNFYSNLERATPYIKGYGYKVAYTWMENNEQGREATKSLDDFFKTQPGLKHKPQNHLYAPHNNVNAWHVAKLGLAKGV